MSWSFCCCISSLPCFVEFHHDPIIISLNQDIVNNIDLVSQNSRYFFKVHYNLISSELNCFDWLSLLNDIDLCLCNAVIDTIVSENIRIRKRSVSSYLSWYSNMLINCLIIWKLSHALEDYIEFKRARMVYKKNNAEV